MRKLLLISAVAIASSAVFADPSFKDVDENNDGKISRSEYNNHVNDIGLYNGWDMDDDLLVNNVEFNELGFDNGYYDTWDVDDDDYLDTVELYDGTWSYYDENEDGHWDGNEWDDAGDAGFWDI